MSAGKGASWSDAKEAQHGILAAAERAASRTRNSLSSSAESSTPGTVQLLPVLSVQAMAPTRQVSKVRLRSFKVDDTSIVRLGLLPDDVRQWDYESSPGSISRDRRTKATETAAPRPARPKPRTNPIPAPPPSYIGVVNDEEPPEAKIAFTEKDQREFSRNRKDLLDALRELPAESGGRPRAGHATAVGPVL